MILRTRSFSGCEGAKRVNNPTAKSGSASPDGRKYGAKGWRHCETHQRCFRGPTCAKCDKDRLLKRIEKAEGAIKQALGCSYIDALCDTCLQGLRDAIL